MVEPLGRYDWTRFSGQADGELLDEAEEIVIEDSPPREAQEEYEM